MSNEKVTKIRDIKTKKISISRRKLGELLVETGLLSGEKLTDALSTQKDTGKRLGQVLIEMELITEEEMGLCPGHATKDPIH